MFSCLQILEAFLWFVLITLLNVTLIILTLSRSEERFSRNAETDLVCRLLLEKKNELHPPGGHLLRVRAPPDSRCCRVGQSLFREIRRAYEPSLLCPHG